MTHRDRHHRRERWLHTRISEDLEEALKREAQRRRSPVSLVVRNVLESALDLVEDIVEDSMKVAHLARSVGGARAGSKREPDSLDDVYGWQELILNREAGCAGCGADLGAGASAYRGLRDEPGGPAVFLCSACIRGLHRSNNDGEEDSQ